MEGQLHKFLKQSVALELQRKNYKLYNEPPESPFSRLWWHSYRPDILGLLSNKSVLQVILVECETKPNQKRVLEKTSQIRSVLSLQKQLYEHHTILPLLVIPPLTLHKVNCLAIRQFWEIWIVNPSGVILHKILRTHNQVKK
ncbi:MAG: hypothetical protein NWF10_04690 [Candidatus Bathyarchaeota archaeon]|jgi:hypothetical protein|nr:hypothetical protein [Candidatus Bathyarchaeota archaeon]